MIDLECGQTDAEEWASAVALAVAHRAERATIEVSAKTLAAMAEEQERLRALVAWAAAEAATLHRQLQQDADSGDFGRGLDERVAVAAELRARLTDGAA
jgi:hypothetical protein